jgi:hypothetical protein
MDGFWEWMRNYGIVGTRKPSIPPNTADPSDAIGLIPEPELMNEDQYRHCLLNHRAKCAANFTNFLLYELYKLVYLTIVIILVITAPPASSLYL